MVESFVILLYQTTNDPKGSVQNTHLILFFEELNT